MPIDAVVILVLVSFILGLLLGVILTRPTYIR